MSDSDTFQYSVETTYGYFYSSGYAWSDGANWVSGAPPADFDSVTIGDPPEYVPTVDDIPGLVLDSLSQTGMANTDVVASSLDIAVLAGGTIAADAASYDSPVTVTIGSIAAFSSLDAYGQGALLIDNSTTDYGSFFSTAEDGVIEFANTPSSGPGAGTELYFFDSSGTFAFEDPQSLIDTYVGNLGNGDTLELPGSLVTDIQYGTNSTFGTNTITITTDAGTYEFDNVIYAQNQTITGYTASFDPSTGLEAITFTAICFLPGALVQTPNGEVPVEALSVGDTVVTWSGAHEPITWIGRSRVLAVRRNAATPVIVKKDALADGVPHADLRVTKGHSFLVDGVLIPVEFLVNHRSIVWDDTPREVTVYHIELARHDVLVANGAPAESFRDDGNRWLFQAEGRDGGTKAPCAPVLTGGPVVDAVWQRLLDRAGPMPPVALDDDAQLHLLVDGCPVAPARRDGRHVLFWLPPARDRSVQIASRSTTPDRLGFSRDPRRLGVAVQSIALIAGHRHRVIQASDERLADGFHAYEPALDIRWTDGAATLPASLFQDFTGPVQVLVQLNGETRYPAEPLALAS